MRDWNGDGAFDYPKNITMSSCIMCSTWVFDSPLVQHEPIGIRKGDRNLFRQIGHRP